MAACNYFLERLWFPLRIYNSICSSRGNFTFDTQATLLQEPIRKSLEQISENSSDGDVRILLKQQDYLVPRGSEENLQTREVIQSFCIQNQISFPNKKVKNTVVSLDQRRTASIPHSLVCMEILMDSKWIPNLERSTHHWWLNVLVCLTFEKGKWIHFS